MPPGNATSVDGALPRAVEETAPKIRHEFVAEKLRTEKAITKNREVTNFIGSSISVPENWISASAQRGGCLQLTLYASPDETAQMLLFDRGIPVKKESVSAFRNLLPENQILTRAKEIPPSAIRKLSDVLGATTIGDNQFVNMVVSIVASFSPLSGK